ncbi:hypothetical protein H045_21090 [Pseudomonas poae RE*1-1-14]|uniref:hypothetical protein n=1 Tax=Pseudomonas poae TaxID=200451 RepID=UPI0002AF4AD8|nr:hypothetical protein [Pseudomonas poae]AGE28280.1 hypothetical protein H045_21090 [Pseudomonas poae RE*1-1-14]
MGWFRKPRQLTYWERREQAFIDAVNKLKTLHVTSEGAMYIDPEEIREQIIASREQLKQFVVK